MISPGKLAAMGMLPIVNKPVRFAVGSPDGASSNSWRVWHEPSGIYILCRDNFRELKVSLHTSGRWRMAVTEEALQKRPDLVPVGENRAWEVWDEPAETVPGVVTAFKLIFLTAELGVSKIQRVGKLWKDVLFVEAGTSEKATIATLFVTGPLVDLDHETEPSFTLARFDLPDGRMAQLMLHGELAASYEDIVRRAKDGIPRTINGAPLPEGSYLYLYGNQQDARFVIGVRQASHLMSDDI